MKIPVRGCGSEKTATALPLTGREGSGHTRTQSKLHAFSNIHIGMKTSMRSRLCNNRKSFASSKLVNAARTHPRKQAHTIAYARPPPFTLNTYREMKTSARGHGSVKIATALLLLPYCSKQRAAGTKHVHAMRKWKVRSEI